MGILSSFLRKQVSRKELRDEHVEGLLQLVPVPSIQEGIERGPDDRASGVRGNYKYPGRN